MGREGKGKSGREDEGRGRVVSGDKWRGGEEWGGVKRGGEGRRQSECGRRGARIVQVCLNGKSEVQSKVSFWSWERVEERKQRAL